METIAPKINRFYSLIGNYQEGARDTRYKSWEWCHQAFWANKDKYADALEEKKEEIVEYLSLHLAFYLASWGMYRGSSYLLQRDYKAHKNAVRAILNTRYDLLWDYEPQSNNIETANKLLFDNEFGIYWIVKNSYAGCDEEAEDADLASDTLTTKILMGTFGCIPAFDRYFKSGIQLYQAKNGGSRRCLISGYKLSQHIETGKGRASESFKALAAFVIQHRRELTVPSNFDYPPMKCVDMYFWEIGYELDLAKGLISENNGDVKKDKIIKQAVKMGLCNSSCGLSSINEVVAQIHEKNGL